MYTPKMWWYQRPRFGLLCRLYRSLRFTERVLPNDPRFDYLNLEEDEYEHILQGAKDALRWEIENLIDYTCRWLMRPITVNLTLLVQALRTVSDARVTKLA